MLTHSSFFSNPFLGRDMNLQEEVERLEKLFSHAAINTSEIIRSYLAIIKKGNSSALNAIIPFLNEKAAHLLSPELSEILKKYRLEAYGYMLVANNLLNTKDVEGDLLKGHVLMDAIPPDTLRKLKEHLDQSSATSSTNPPYTQQNEVATVLTSASPIQAPTTSQHQPDEVITGDENAMSSIEHGVINRLPVKIRALCTSTKIVDDMILHKLPLKIESSFDGASSIVQRFSFGEPDRSAGRKSKTILLMGATGSGKTTMINAMINNILGVEWDDPFRFVLVDEDVREASQADSQTQGVTAYDIHHMDGFRIPFSLTIVDTPGFGDTGGIGRDKEITTAIQTYFQHKNGIQELDAVGFVVQSALVRLTYSKKHIFNSVLSIFGQDIGENIRFLVTFADGDVPPVLETIKEAKLPCLMDANGSPCHHSFNNCAIYKSKASANIKRLHHYWEDGIESMKSFFDDMSDMPTKSLQMTKEVLDMKKYLEIQLDFMHRDINKQLMKMEELRKTEQVIALNRDKVDANKNFEVRVPMSKKVKVEVGGQKALNCTTCQVTCHYPCNPSLWSGFCPAFWQSENIVPNMEGVMNVVESITKLKSEPLNRRVLSAVVDTVKNTASNLVSCTCKVCPGNCPGQDHKNEAAKWDFIQQEETITMDDVRKKYEEAMGQQLSAEGILSGLQIEVEQLKSDIIKTMAEITRCSNDLREKALRGDPLSILEYIQMIMDDERKGEKPGYEERIKSLEDVLKRARLTQGIVVGGELH